MEEICCTAKGAATKVTFETVVAEDQANKYMDRSMREGGNPLTTREMETAHGTRQMAPGCASIQYPSPHTQNICMANIVNSMSIGSDRF